MSALEYLNKLSQESVNSLVAQNTTRDLAEALAICVRSLKDKDGKLVLVHLSDDFEQEMDFYFQIAKMLRNENDCE